MPTRRKAKPTSIDRQLNAAWLEYTSDTTKETQLVAALTRLAKTVAYTYNLTEPDDAIQDALLKIWSYKDTYKPAKASFATWAGSVVRQVCNDHKSRLTTQRRTHVALDTLSKRDFDKQLEDKGWQVEAQERAVAIDKALGKLSGVSREVVELHLRGMSLSEIAAKLQITYAAAFQRWDRALDEIADG